MLVQRVGYDYKCVGHDYNCNSPVDQVVNPEFVARYNGSGFDYKNRCQSGSAKPPGSGGGTGNGQSSFGEVPTGSSAGSPYTNCCGEYPNREPYNNQRQTCCGQGELAYPFLVTFGAC